jgi:chorismate synthase
MTGSSFGRVFRLTTFGESHGPGVGCILDGCPSNLRLSKEDVQRELDRRKPGQSAITTQRAEEDRVEVLSGVFEGRTLGTPIGMIVYNKEAKPGAYEEIKDKFRPGHADYGFFAKFGLRDWRGGGRSSGRETLTRVAGGAVAKKLVSLFGIEIVGHVVQAAGVNAMEIPMHSWDKKLVERIRAGAESNAARCADEGAAGKMIAAIEKAKGEGDSTGGIVEVVAVGAPPGLGEPVFDKLDAEVAAALMSIGAVKGVEVGAGFSAAGLRGSECNDSFYLDRKEKRVATKTNRHGGVLGGISTGMPIVARIAVKPTSSIAKSQKTINERLEEVEAEVTGRHDPNICPRIVPVAEAMLALVLADNMILQGIIPRKLQ